MNIDLTETEIKLIRLLVVERAIIAHYPPGSADAEEDFRANLLEKLRCALNGIEESERQHTIN